MARRMFSPQIVSSDAFLDMPTSSRELYFQFGMAADDDGFVNPRKIMRIVGASEDDLRVLVGKRFVLPFDNGVIVIKHWKINNLVRKDWYKETAYLEQKKKLFLKQNGAYTEDSSRGLPLVNELVNVGKVRLGNTNTHTVGVAVNENNKKTMKKNTLGKYREDQAADSYETVIDSDTGESEKIPAKGSNSTLMKELIEWAESKRGGKFLNYPKQLKALSNLRNARIPPGEIKNRWSMLSEDNFYQTKGMDFMDVYNSFDKKPLK